jgi:predicted nucleic acid-binding protein
VNSYFVDTNIFVYAEQAEPRDKHERAEQILVASLRSGRGVISTQVIAEMTNVLARRVGSRHDRHDIGRRVRTVSDFWPVRDVDSEVSGLALTIWERHAISFWDAQILAAAISSGCDTIITEDTRETIAGVRYVNPFASGFDPAELA